MVDSVVAAVTVVESAIAGKRLALIQTPKDLRPRPLLYKGHYAARAGSSPENRMTRCARYNIERFTFRLGTPTLFQIITSYRLACLSRAYWEAANWKVSFGARLALTAGHLPQTFINAGWFNREPLTLVHGALCRSTSSHVV